MSALAGMDDPALVRAMTTGDEAALRELFGRHAPWLRARLSRRCGDPEAVADVLQDTFVAAWRSARRWRGDGEVAALDGVDVALHVGVTGLLGPNGAGKTTLLRLLTTAVAPSAGRVTVFGREATGSLPERTEVRRQLGYLPQEVHFPRGLTCFAFVDYIAVLKEWTDTARRHAEVRRVLDLVGLGDRSTTKIRALSGGQRRRLALAQSFLGDPGLLVLDEPTTGLDPEQRASLRALLSEQGRTGVVLLATHQTEDVAALCERVVVIAGGRLRFDGTGGSVAAEPSVEDAYLLMLGADALPNEEVAA